MFVQRHFEYNLSTLLEWSRVMSGCEPWGLWALASLWVKNLHICLRWWKPWTHFLWKSLEYHAISQCDTPDRIGMEWAFLQYLFNLVFMTHQHKDTFPLILKPITQKHIPISTLDTNWSKLLWAHALRNVVAVSELALFTCTFRFNMKWQRYVNPTDKRDLIINIKSILMLQHQTVL